MQQSQSDLSNIHRLVQEVIRIDLKNKGKEKEFLNDAIYSPSHNSPKRVRYGLIVVEGKDASSI